MSIGRAAGNGSGQKSEGMQWSDGDVQQKTHCIRLHPRIGYPILHHWSRNAQCWAGTGVAYPKKIELQSQWLVGQAFGTRISAMALGGWQDQRRGTGDLYVWRLWSRRWTCVHPELGHRWVPVYQCRYWHWVALISSDLSSTVNSVAPSQDQ